MKTLVLLALAVASSSAFAAEGKKILECNLSFGPDQAVTVRQTTNGLVLEELTNSGGTVSRALSQKEYDSHDIKLRIESPLDSGHMYFEKSEWVYDVGGAMGYADCTPAKPRR